MPQMAPILWFPLFLFFLALSSLMLFFLFFEAKSLMPKNSSSSEYSSKNWVW